MVTDSRSVLVGVSRFVSCFEHFRAGAVKGLPDTPELKVTIEISDVEEFLL
jgi:hypothetical protein